MKRRKKFIFALPVLLLGLIVMGYAGHQMLETKQIYQEGTSAYERLGDRVKKTVSEDHPQPQVAGIVDFEHTLLQDQEEKTPIYIPNIEIDFDVLKTVNKDAAAWLYSPGTVIDYPVMEADDYYYYLNHLPDGTVNSNGSLFIDFNNAADFSGQLTVVYGHHMKSGLMFGGLVGYKEQAYYDAHPFMYLYTEYENYRIDLMYGFVISAGQWKERAFMYEENLESFLAHAMQNTTFESGVNYEEGDRVVALSTCSYEFNNARYVVVGILKSNN